MLGFRTPDHSNWVQFALGIALVCFGALQAAEARILPSVKARAPKSEVSRLAGLPSDAELVESNARIGEIRFDARDLFDTESEDEDTSVSRVANRLHITTRQSTIA